ncbi:hypothetical protein Hanom_Chr05g00458201 [Helianthus anomalus]
METASIFLRDRGKTVYIYLPSSDPILALLLIRFTEYDDDHDELVVYLQLDKAICSECSTSQAVLVLLLLVVFLSSSCLKIHASEN